MSYHNVSTPRPVPRMHVGCGGLGRECVVTWVKIAEQGALHVLIGT